MNLPVGGATIATSDAGIMSGMYWHLKGNVAPIPRLSYENKL